MAERAAYVALVYYRNSTATSEMHFASTLEQACGICVCFSLREPPQRTMVKTLSWIYELSLRRNHSVMVDKDETPTLCINKCQLVSRLDLSMVDHIGKMQ